MATPQSLGAIEDFRRSPDGLRRPKRLVGPNRPRSSYQGGGARARIEDGSGRKGGAAGEVRIRERRLNIEVAGADSETS